MFSAPSLCFNTRNVICHLSIHLEVIVINIVVKRICHMEVPLDFPILFISHNARSCIFCCLIPFVSHFMISKAHSQTPFGYFVANERNLKISFLFFPKTILFRQSISSNPFIHGIGHTQSDVFFSHRFAVLIRHYLIIECVQCCTKM